MIVKPADKVHVVYRALHENSARRHFVGEVVAAEGALCRLEGYAFIYDAKSTMFAKKPGIRTTIMDLAENGYIVNVIDPAVKVENISYRYLRDIGLVATDNERFSLDINEFGVKS